MIRTGFFFPVFLACILSACSEQEENVVKKTDPLEAFDTLYVQKTSALTINRYRVYLNKNALFQMGKMKMKMSIKDLETGLTSTYAIDSGMLVYNKTYFKAHCYINTSQIKTATIDSTQHLQLATPEYLLRNAKPYFIIEYQGNFFPKAQSPSASCYLTLNDSTALLNNAQSQVEAKNNIITSIKTQAYVDGLKWKLFEPRNEEEIKQDSIRLNVEVLFGKSNR